MGLGPQVPCGALGGAARTLLFLPIRAEPAGIAVFRGADEAPRAGARSVERLRQSPGSESKVGGYRQSCVVPNDMTEHRSRKGVAGTTRHKRCFRFGASPRLVTGEKDRCASWIS